MLVEFAFSKRKRDARFAGVKGFWERSTLYNTLAQNAERAEEKLKLKSKTNCELCDH